MSFLKSLFKDACGRPVPGWTGVFLLINLFLLFLFTRPYFQGLTMETLFLEQLISLFVFWTASVFFLGHGLMFAVRAMENRKNPWAEISSKQIIKTGLSFVFCQTGLTVLGVCLVLPLSLTMPQIAALVLLAYLIVVVVPYDLLFLQRQPEGRLPALRHTLFYFRKNWLRVLDILGAAVVISLILAAIGNGLNDLSRMLARLDQAALFWSINVLFMVLDLLLRVYSFFVFMRFAGAVAAQTREAA